MQFCKTSAVASGDEQGPVASDVMNIYPTRALRGGRYEIQLRVTDPNQSEEPTLGNYKVTYVR